MQGWQSDPGVPTQSQIGLDGIQEHGEAPEGAVAEQSLATQLGWLVCLAETVLALRATQMW